MKFRNRWGDGLTIAESSEVVGWTNILENQTHRNVQGVVAP